MSWKPDQTTMSRWRRTTAGVIWLGLLTPLVLYGINIWQRPSTQPLDRQPLFNGITYSRQRVSQPRPHMIHVVDIDLTAPGLKPLATPGYAGAEPNTGGIGRETLAQRTSDFVEAQGLQLAINANFFFPFREVTPWNYEPWPGQPTNVVGLVLSDGNTVSLVERKRPLPALCFMETEAGENQARIQPEGTCGDGTKQAVAGNLMLLAKGQPTEMAIKQIGDEQNKPYPFTIAALDASGQRLWLLAIDGKQPLYSEGMTLAEVVDWVQALGADTALRLDGGGSTTVAISTPTGPQVLNSPIHAKIPGDERPVANHLGFFAQPLEP